MDNLGRTSASGVVNLGDHEINTRRYAGGVLNKGLENEILPEITNMQFFKDVFTCHDEVIFKNPIEVGAWRPYEDNQQMKYDQPKRTVRAMRICNQAYKGIKIDAQLKRQLCHEWESYREEFMQACYDSLSELWHTYVLSAMVLTASPKNKGQNVGRGRNINLGILGKPVELTPENLVDHLQDLRQVLVQRKRWVEGEMFIILPTELDRIFVNSRYAALQEHCCNNGSQLLKGEKPHTVFGFRVITSMRVPVGIDPVSKKYTGYILAFWNKAFAFYGNIHHNRYMPLQMTMGEVYEMGCIFGGEHVYPDATVVSYVTLT